MRPLLLRSSLLTVLAAAGCSHDAPGNHALAHAGPEATVEIVAPPPPAPTPAASTTAALTTAAPGASAAPQASAAPAAPPAGPRIYARARFAWIQAEPHASRGWIGYLGLGSSIALKGGSAEAAKAPHSEGVSGCRAWYAVEPRGYVCDGDAATLDADDPAVRAVAAEAPKTDSPWPYEYGESTGAPRYKKPPTEAQQRKSEWNLAEHLGLIAKAKAGEAPDKALAGIDLSPAVDGRWGKYADIKDWLEASPLVREGRPFVANGSTVAWAREVDIDGRTYLVTHDLALVPKDRVKPYPRSDFHGVDLNADAQLPLAFFRKTDRPKYRRAADGSFEKTGETWPRLTWVALTGEEAKVDKQTFLATKEPGVWVLASEAAVARKSEPPAIVRRMKSGRRTWMDISVLGGTMVAYEGDTPVFATMISPGRGGIPERGKDPLSTASTPTGTFRVDGKFVTATMVSSTNDLLVHTEVQYVQNFHGPHALHAAYWHDAWGEKKSGGCVNLSPTDAQKMFAWTEPTVPKDWYGMRSLPEFGPATVVVVHK